LGGGEGKHEGKNHLEDPGVDGRIILTWIFRKWDREAWTGFIWAQDRDRWRALLNTVMSLRVA